jgi:hypothetical protein
VDRAVSAILPVAMKLDLTDEESSALLRELRNYVAVSPI